MGNQPIDEHAAATARVQVGVLRGAFGTDLGVVHDVEGDDATTLYLHREGHVLIDSDRIGDLQTHFSAHPEVYDGVGQIHHEPIQGLSVYALPARRTSGETHHDTHTDIDAALGEGVATPDHVIYLTNECWLCPANEPNEPGPTAPWPTFSANAHHGTGIHIGVVDTGWWTGAATDPDTPWLHNGVGGDAEAIDPNDIHPYGGHGTFVAGVIRCQAPASQVHVYGMLTKGGAIFESELVKELDLAAFGANSPQIISISGGTHTRNDRPLKAFEALAAKRGLHNNPNAPLIIAAAGNDATDKPFWPAAFNWVAGVGSVDADDAVSDYSNYGKWVDIFALGRDHVNAFPTGTYRCYEPANAGQVRKFAGLAKWSGTSFSTPLVAGAVAATMTEHGLNAHDAWAKVKADAATRHDARVGEIKSMPTPV